MHVFLAEPQKGVYLITRFGTFRCSPGGKALLCWCTSSFAGSWSSWSECIFANTSCRRSTPPLELPLLLLQLAWQPLPGAPT